MIKLSKLNKFYNRNSPNEIHVINDINLTLPETGLVVLLGPSGSGKTTLLNVLGGLDKVHSGSIQFGEQVIGRYSSRVWDQIRNKEVGYIFQNYNLLTNLTVYENISLTLNMIGIYDKDEIDKRIDYILGNIGMINYRKRRAAQLSGGQQQRVAIARALAKNPRVIIADEPTGNLDSKNTQDIMNIIKSISENKLVVLVTHEEEIASFYGDRIIRLVDGQIVRDDENRSNGTLDLRHDTDIYLKDLRQVEDSTTEKGTFQLFTDEDNEDQLDVRLIVKNKTIYIDVNSKEYSKIQLIGKDSEINILDKHYEHVDRDNYQSLDFNLESIIQEEQTDHTKHSVISIKDSVRLAFSRIKATKFWGKMFYLGLVFVSVLIALATGMLGNIMNMDPANFQTAPRELVVFNKVNNDYDDVLRYVSHNSVDYLQLSNTTTIIANLPTVYQSHYRTQDITNMVIYHDYMDGSMISGRTVEANNEFVIDQILADNILNNNSFQNLGVNSYEDLYKLEYHVMLNGAEKQYEYEMELVGIVNSQNPAIYATKELIYEQRFTFGIYEFYEDDITLSEGVNISEEFDILHLDDGTWDTIARKDTKASYDQTFDVTGYFETELEDVPQVLVKMADIEKAYFNFTYTEESQEISLFSNDNKATIEYLKTQQVVAESVYSSNLLVYRLNRIAQNYGTLIFIAVVLGASIISYFFLIRSSLMQRIYEVSVYRALGVTKLDIHKMFTTETVFITTMTGLIGYGAMTFIIYRIQLYSEDFWEVFHVTPLSVLLGLLSIYMVNIFSGLIPVANLLNRTPAEILSKYDF